NFENITGTLGSGSATIDGITFFNSDPTAVLTVSSPAGLALTGNLLSLGGNSTASPTVVGFKSADGSEFSCNGLDFYGPFNSVIILDGYRNGVLVLSGGVLTPSGPSQGTFQGYENIDELRLTGPDNSPILIDEIVF